VTESSKISKKDQAILKVRGLDYPYASQRFVSTGWNCYPNGGILRHRGGCEPSVTLGIPASPAEPGGAFMNQWIRMLTLAYGLACVAAGGYVAARIARRLPIKHAAAMGILQAGLTIAAMLSPEANHATRMQWITIAILSIPAALAGGFLYKGKKTQ